MRRDALYLSDIAEACDDIASFVSGVDRSAFLQDNMRASAVLQKLTIIGEAIARLTAELKTGYPDIEWTAMSGMRNRIVHGYFHIDLELIWVAATEECPPLRAQIQAILNTEFTDL